MIGRLFYPGSKHYLHLFIIRYESLQEQIAEYTQLTITKPAKKSVTKMCVYFFFIESVCCKIVLKLDVKAMFNSEFSLSLEI